VSKGCPGTWEVSSPPARAGTIVRGKTSSVGVTRSRSAAVRAMTPGNQPEGPGQAKGGAGISEPSEGTMGETPSSPTVSTKIERIAKLAREIPDRPLRTLAHHIDVDWLREAYRRTRKDGARGIDGQSAGQYAERLEENLQSLLDRAKSG